MLVMDDRDRRATRKRDRIEASTQARVAAAVLPLVTVGSRGHQTGVTRVKDLAWRPGLATLFVRNGKAWRAGGPSLRVVHSRPPKPARNTIDTIARNRWSLP